MTTWKNEEEAREQIKALVTGYYHDFKEHMQLECSMKRKCVP